MIRFNRTISGPSFIATPPLPAKKWRQHLTKVKWTEVNQSTLGYLKVLRKRTVYYDENNDKLRILSFNSNVPRFY